MITGLGLLDRDLAEHHAAFGIQTRDFQHGVAYPAVFVLDDAGVVASKRIGESYRAREGALKLLEGALGVTLVPGGERKTAAANHVTVTAVTDSPTYMRWQETRLHVLFDVDQGWHVYGRPIPDGYIPLTVEVTGIPELEVRSPQFPPTRPLRVEGLDEQFHVHEGHFEVVVPFVIKVAQGHGPFELKVRVRYQTCSERDCLQPSSLTLELSLDEASAA